MDAVARQIYLSLAKIYSFLYYGSRDESEFRECCLSVLQLSFGSGLWQKCYEIKFRIHLLIGTHVANERV